MDFNTFRDNAANKLNNLKYNKDYIVWQGSENYLAFVDGFQSKCCFDLSYKPNFLIAPFNFDFSNEEISFISELLKKNIDYNYFKYQSKLFKKLKQLMDKFFPHNEEISVDQDINILYTRILIFCCIFDNVILLKKVFKIYYKNYCLHNNLKDKLKEYQKIKNNFLVDKIDILFKFSASLGCKNILKFIYSKYASNIDFFLSFQHDDCDGGCAIYILNNKDTISLVNFINSKELRDEIISKIKNMYLTNKVCQQNYLKQKELKFLSFLK